MTPHINAKKGEIAKVVLMPGDPLRAKFISDTFLKDVKQVNTVRNMFMYTGTYNGKLISVCGSGMGQASIGIYSFELFNFFNVDKIVRIGSAGAYKADLKLYDTVLATSAYSDSTAFAELILEEKTHTLYPSKKLNEEIMEISKKLNIAVKEVPVHSSDVFYSSVSLEERIKASQSDCVEMESGALFANAKKLGKEAACLLTISDNLITKEETSAEERQSSFLNMMKIALELAV
jgi:purine-nucleoside phosphorylase